MTSPSAPPDGADGSSDEPLRVFVLSGSSREASVNSRLARLTARLVARRGVETEFATVRDTVLPVYDGDDEAAHGPPEPAAVLRDRIRQADAMVIASPEYNASVPGVVKNAVDWVSRFRPQPFKDKQTLLVSASPSLVGGNRGLWALRVPLEHLGARVYPDMFSLAEAHQAFAESGDLHDQGLQERLTSTVDCFLELVEADVRYPALRHRWYEFPGDRSDAPVTLRAEG
ncbi:NADPH-dependent FMN reductase [Streptomyces sp. JJ38]|uniref:NADPH-dependent FMN reductase n=1 Tax=Streptomyces sp. JJ38 TaxID=2738128 RepID=UPI001C58E32A|nr:NAD(P)H-dependent oxidoreductase [Streptomyces sp. JJ38]MBW1595887.1 NAD(P)H-dependent oxidoreductase [Streptomyces sp. JJ38]